MKTQDQQMRALHQASLSLFSDLSLDGILNRIVQAAMDLGQARYAALAVPDEVGGLGRFIPLGMSERQQAGIAHPPIGEGLIGEMLRQQSSLRVRNISDHPAAVGFPPGHPHMSSFLGVPIIGFGRPLGQIYLADRAGAEEFTEEDQRLVEMLAAYAVAAIEIARLNQQARRVAVLEERERIGMDLHDGIIQSIYAVGLSLDFVQRTLREQSNPAEARIHEAIDGLNAVIRDLRSYILDLQPSQISTDGLQGALAALGKEFRANTLMEVDLQLDHELGEWIANEPAAVIFHIAREALANVAKHARATHTWVTLRRVDQDVLMQIIDNGNGFDYLGTDAHLGHGLSNMQERAQLVGGRLEVVTKPGDGTTVTLRLPANQVSGQSSSGVD